MLSKEEKRISIFGKSWYEVLKNEFDKEYMIRLNKTLSSEYSKYLIRPDRDQIFNAFKFCPYNEVKVVIIGLDPYPHKHANGISFSSSIGMTVSLSKIFEQLEIDDKVDGEVKNRIPDLKDWVDQGVLLLNARLTVRDGHPNSHNLIGWEMFIRKVCNTLLIKRNIVFLTMGTIAKNTIEHLQFDKYNCLHIHVEHPAAASYNNRGWITNNCFYKMNHFMVRNNIKVIEW